MAALLLILVAHLATPAPVGHTGSPPVLTVPPEMLNDDIVVFGRNDKAVYRIDEKVESPNVDLAVITGGLVRGVVGPPGDMLRAEAAWNELNKSTRTVTR